MPKRVMAAIAAMSATVAGAASPALVELKPSTSWHLDYAETYCRLAREFGTDGHKTLFYLEQYEPGAGFAVLVAGHAIEAEKLRRPSVRFAPVGGAAVGDRLTPSTMETYGSGFLVSGMPLLAEDEGASRPADPGVRAAARKPVDPRDAAPITALEVLGGNTVKLRLLLGPMDRPVEAMNACTEELLTHWGIDVAQHRTRMQAPEPANYPGDWLNASDYPKDLLQVGAQGLVWIRLNVDENGNPTACEVQQKTDPPGFADVVCQQVMKKARFRPALNAEGKPMKSYWRTSVRFKSP
ncbi:energy transducer TonB [Tsuneonella sp. YG55]|uniref:Energy transducer TonB n=1 Tax=Tsuneonella litorea TaxID=2976475 RepID=A0A9X2W2R0_9SPHN|nr:energy transducer TonB [Tsuneonella litorea]MCT2559898.1 energy transducer TonB [Tsuneonella litorea]